MGYIKRAIFFVLVLGLGCLVFGSSPARDEGSSAAPGLRHAARYGVARSSDLPPPAPSPHPLEPALKIARQCLANIENNIQDYSALMVKREQVAGKLADAETLVVKIRQHPFSVYTEFVVPEELKGQQAVYVEGLNGGNLLARGAGLKALLGIVSLDPTGFFAMQGQRYPITEIGILNLTKRLIEVASEDSRYGECEVSIVDHDVKVDGRPCTCIEVTHPLPRKVFRFYKARVFIDQQLDIPIRYESFDWPATPGDEPPLMEQYTYEDVKLNNGFTDADFEIQ